MNPNDVEKDVCPSVIFASMVLHMKKIKTTFNYIYLIITFFVMKCISNNNNRGSVFLIFL